MSSFKEQDIIQLCIERLADIYGLPVRLIGSKPVGGGCINHAVKVTSSQGDFFLKWNANGPADLFVKEAEGLNEMEKADNSFLIVPKVIWSKPTDDLPGLLLMEYLHPASSTPGFDERLGRGIAQLHRHIAPEFGFYHSNYCGTTLQDNTWNSNWPDFFAQQRILTLVNKIKTIRGLPASDQQIYARLVDKMPQLLDHPTIPSLIHGDLWSGNYMYTANGPALIDPACYYADREMELGMMQLFGGFSPTVWKSYQEAYPLPDGWQRRIQLYQLYHLLNHHLLFGGSYGQQAIGIAKMFL